MGIMKQIQIDLMNIYKVKNNEELRKKTKGIPFIVLWNQVQDYRAGRPVTHVIDIEDRET